MQISRHILAGWLILVMLGSTLIGGWAQLFSPLSLLWLSGCAAWLAALLLIGDITTTLKIQVAIMVGLGLIFIVYGHINGIAPDFVAIAAGNTGLLTMICAVGFIRLIALSAIGEARKLPTGANSYLHTLVSTAVFGSFINISAALIIADRIHETRPIQLFTSHSIVRVFCACATWSPFFAATAVVLTNVGDADLLTIILSGFPFALICWIVVYLDGRFRYQSEVADFVGYPIRWGSLWIPMVLAVGVLAGRLFFPALSVLVQIASVALIMTITTLVYRSGWRSAMRQLHHYIETNLPRSVNELTLFLSAGVLASGIAALVKTGAFEIPVEQFDALAAIGLFVSIVVLAIVGVHPVIPISSITPLVLVLEPNLALLATVYLMSWNLGTAASPLSGTNIVFQARYGIPSWRAALRNGPYVGLMTVVGSGWLWLLAQLTGI